MAFPDPFKRLVFTVSDLSPNYQLWLWSCVLSFLRDTPTSSSSPPSPLFLPSVQLLNSLSTSPAGPASYVPPPPLQNKEMMVFDGFSFFILNNSYVRESVRMLIRDGQCGLTPYWEDPIYHLGTRRCVCLLGQVFTLHHTL